MKKKSKENNDSSIKRKKHKKRKSNNQLPKSNKLFGQTSMIKPSSSSSRAGISSRERAMSKVNSQINLPNVSVPSIPQSSREAMRSYNASYTTNLAINRSKKEKNPSFLDPNQTLSPKNF